MTVFFIFAALMVFAALALMLPGMLRSEPGRSTDQLSINVSIAKERRDMLDKALAAGSIDQETFDTEQADLQRTLAADMAALSADSAGAPRARRGGKLLPAIVALFVPLAAGALYLHLGNPAAIDTEAMHARAVEQLQSQQAQADAQTAPALADLLPELERKLEANPEDRNGWKLLGRTYLTISEFARAEKALVRAYELDPADPDLLAQLAEATAMQRGGDLSGKPTEFLESALSLDPQHDQSRWLMAIATQQAGKHESALEQFEALKASVNGDTGALATIEQMMDRSREVLGIASGSTNNAEASEATDMKTHAVSVKVTISDEALADVEPGMAVFVYARASQGPPMPLAVARATVADLPLSVLLDDSMAMMPTMKLSGFDSVTVGARVSKSGDPVSAAGDWFVEQENIAPAGQPELNLQINTQK